jgi:hypothetical protein
VTGIYRQSSTRSAKGSTAATRTRSWQAIIATAAGVLIDMPVMSRVSDLPYL